MLMLVDNHAHLWRHVQYSPPGLAKLSSYGLHTEKVVYVCWCVCVCVCVCVCLRPRILLQPRAHRGKGAPLMCIHICVSYVNYLNDSIVYMCIIYYCVLACHPLKKKDALQVLRKGAKEGNREAQVVVMSVLSCVIGLF
jgi:hypothetical protein